MHIKNANMAALQQISTRVQINALDKETLNITTSSRAIDLLSILAHPIAAVLPILSPNVQDSGIFSIDPNTWRGIGAFVPDLIENDTLILKRNSSSIVTAFIKKINFIYVNNINTAMSLQKEGKIDWMYIPQKYSITTADSAFFTDIQEQAKKAEEQSATKNKDFKNPQTNLETIQFVSQVALEIPEYSILRRSFLDNRNITKTIDEIYQMKYSLLLDPQEEIDMQEIMTKISNDIKNILYQHYNQKENKAFKFYESKHLYMPFTILPPQNVLDKYLLAKVITGNNQNVEEKNNIENDLPSEIFPDNANTANIPNVDIQLDTVAAPVIRRGDITELFNSYTNKVKNLLRDKTFNRPSINIAYNNDFLEEFAQLIVDYFELQGISATLFYVPEKSAPDDKKYDIVLRNIQSISWTNLGILSSFWWYTAGGDEPPLRVLGNATQLLNDLLSSDDSETFFSNYLKLIQDFAITSRFIPIWYVPKHEFIIIEKYPWWSPQVSWHPLYQ